jgi:hypothetical protein
LIKKKNTLKITKKTTDFLLVFMVMSKYVIPGRGGEGAGRGREGEATGGGSAGGRDRTGSGGMGGTPCMSTINNVRIIFCFK